MLLASSMVGMRPPIHAAQPASSSYEAKTGQSKANLRGTGPYIVLTVLPCRKDSGRSALEECEMPLASFPADVDQEAGS